MKISKTIQWALVVGIFAILIISAIVVYGRQMEEKSQLSTNIAQSHQYLAKRTSEYPKEKNQLQSSLYQLNSQIASIQKESHKPTESIEIEEAIFNAANETNVTLTWISASMPKEQNLRGTTYSVFNLGVQAKGEVVALLNFSSKLSQKFPDSTIENVSVDAAGGSMMLQLKIYTYQGK